MTEIDLLQGIFILQFLHMLISMGVLALYAIAQDKRERKENNEKLKETVKQMIKEEQEKDK